MVLDESAETEKVRTVVSVYIPCCLTPALLTGVRSPCEAWSILRDRTNKLRIFEACSPLLSCLRVRLLSDYKGDLDSRLAHLSAPPQRAALAKKISLLFKQVLPVIWTNLAPAIPESVPSSDRYKPLLPPSSYDKLWSYLRGTNRPAPNRLLVSIPYTPPRPGATSIIATACNPCAAPNIPVITFSRLW